MPYLRAHPREQLREDIIRQNRRVDFVEMGVHRFGSGFGGCGNYRIWNQLWLLRARRLFGQIGHHIGEALRCHLLELRLQPVAVRIAADAFARCLFIKSLEGRLVALKFVPLRMRFKVGEGQLSFSGMQDA